MKILISGTGNMAHRHLKIVQEFFPKAFLFGFSKSGAYLKDVHMLHDENLLTTNFDFAIIANASPSHCEIARKIVGKKILMEKPVSNNLNQALDLSRSQQAQDICVGYHLRQRIGCKFVHNLLENKVIGDVNIIRSKVGHSLTRWRHHTDYQKSVSAQKHLGGEVLLELSHDLDYIRYLFGMPIQVFCRTSHSGVLLIDKNVEDKAFCLLVYDNFHAEISLNMIELPPTRYCEIIGSLGSIHWNLRNDKVKVFLNSANGFVDELQNKLSNQDTVYQEQFIEFLKFFKGDPTAHVVSLIEAVNTLKIVDACRASSLYKKYQLL